jgi:hypothetical protein
MVYEVALSWRDPVTASGYHKDFKTLRLASDSTNVQVDIGQFSRPFKKTPEDLCC